MLGDLKSSHNRQNSEHNTVSSANPESGWLYVLVGGWGVDGRVPMSHVDYKKW